MILEIATIDIKPDANAAFESRLDEAQHILKQSPGYVGHQFQRCVEEPNRYVLLIRWETLEAHTVGFRTSELFQQWRGLIGEFFQNPPMVQHFELLVEG